jgi:SWI/SNF-related matrix-associated actin-dependent regulator of chromatin subfamily A-like protein 1
MNNTPELKYVGALHDGSGFGVALHGLDRREFDLITSRLRVLKTQDARIKFHPAYFPYKGKNIGAWTVPANPHIAENLTRLVADYALQMSEDATALLDRIKHDHAETPTRHASNRVQSSAFDAPPVDVPGLVGDLRGYQRAAVHWALRNRKVYIADDMGTGKTLSAMAACAAAGALPVVVVCPASVKLGWERQVNRFFPDLNVYVASGKKNRDNTPASHPTAYNVIPRNTDVFIINYDVAGAWQPLTTLSESGSNIEIFDYHSIIIDEAHFIKSPKAKRTKAVAALANRVDFRIALSGTPMVNRPIEIVPQLEVIGRMDEFLEGGARPKWHFVNRYCAPTHNGYGWDVSGASNLYELSQKLREYGIVIRRTKDEIMGELPPKERVTIPFALSNRNAYDKIIEDLRYWVEARVASDEELQRELAMMPEDVRIKRRGYAIAERLFRASKAEALVRLGALRQTCIDGKIDGVTEWAKDFMTTDEKLIIFCIHRKTVNHLYEAFGDKSVRIYGGMNMEKRQAAIDSFVNDDNVRLVIANIDAAAEGIDGWQEVCSNVAFAELAWSPVRHRQAEDRLHRSGQKNPVTCYYLLADQSVDETLAGLLDRKNRIISAALDGREIEEDESILVGLLARVIDGVF